jgi:hypothetical protein
MKSSDEIFRLIKSMNRKEKLFFRKKALSLYSDEDGNYLKLFDEIAFQSEKCEDYDEKKIKDGNYSGKFVKNLSVHKNYLYNMILESLELYQRNSKPAIVVRNLLSQAELLLDKQLYDQSLKLIQRAIRIAEDKNIVHVRYDLVNLERTIRKYTMSINEYETKSKELFDEQYGILELNKNLLDYYQLNETVGIFLRSYGAGRTRDEDQQKQFEEVFSNPLLKSIDNAKSFMSKYIFYNLNLQYHLTNTDYESAYKFAKAGTELWENNPGMLTGKLDNYIFSLNNLINAQDRSKRYEEQTSTIEKLKSISVRYPEVVTEANKTFIFYSSSISLLAVSITKIDQIKLRSVINETSERMNDYEEKVTTYQRIILYYFLSIANFVIGDYEKCVYWNSKIFNIGKTDLSEDYQCYARIIQLLSYYELGYIDAMEYALRSAYHFISKRKRIYKYENIIQQYLRKSFRIKNDVELYRMFDDMMFDLGAIADDEYEKNAFDAFDLRPWLESKIKGVSLIDLLITKQEAESSQKRN